MNRIVRSLKSAVPRAFVVIGWLLKTMLPLSLAVQLMKYYGLIDIVSHWLTPLFILIGLPGEGSLVFISSLFLPIYAPIAVIGSLNLGLREITILAVMCLISHNLVIESAVQKRAGSSAIRMTVVRIVFSFISAILLNWVLPHDMGTAGITAHQSVVCNSINDVLLLWLTSSLRLTLRIVMVVTGLMFLHKVLDDMGWMKPISNFFVPILRPMGLPEITAFQWVVAQVVGLAYGAAILFEEVESGRLPKKDADILNHHIAINHSQLEDTLLFVSIGANFLWITLPRIILATALVWGLHGWKALKTRNDER